MLIQVTNKYFCAGFIYEKNKWMLIAPILIKHIKNCNWNISNFRKYCETKRWKWYEV